MQESVEKNQCISAVRYATQLYLHNIIIICVQYTRVLAAGIFPQNVVIYDIVTTETWCRASPAGCLLSLICGAPNTTIICTYSYFQQLTNRSVTLTPRVPMRQTFFFNNSSPASPVFPLNGKNMHLVKVIQVRTKLNPPLKIKDVRVVGSRV